MNGGRSEEGDSTRRGDYPAPMFMGSGQALRAFRDDKRWRTRVEGNIIDWDKIETETVIPGFHGKFAHSNTMTFVLWQIDKDAILPEHSHIHEQVVHVYEGELQVTVAGKTSVLKAGSVGVIPPNAFHSGKALTNCRVMDAFHPRREDYMKGGAPSVLRDAMKRA
jgi:quercetin dioxygenase-like cupin family protein